MSDRVLVIDFFLGGVKNISLEYIEGLKCSSFLPFFSCSFLHNEGQNVHSINRIFVHVSILQSFKERFIRLVQRLKLGSPHETNTQVSKVHVQFNSVRPSTKCTDISGWAVRFIMLSPDQTAHDSR